ncbi:phosphonate metabolism protein PhnP [Betaproteobacteria bacterium]|nr:phosphonate metabolism protein PhnP [Betaproteobacteria bacterium]GHU17741.1 phosphonate metabolism protein PhnP [Betaproteobacteria bacterium]
MTTDLSDAPLRLTFLGTGDAAQTPAYGCHCPACERARRDESRRRRPCSALLEAGGQRYLIDSGLTDLAERFPAGSLDGILQTHYHADHAQGLLHLRWGKGAPLPVLGPPDPEGFADLYKHPGPLDFSNPFQAFERRALGQHRKPGGQIFVTAILLAHSKITFGYLIEYGERKLAYLTDTSGLPDESKTFLQQFRLDALILDCTHPPTAPDAPARPQNHNDLTRALADAHAIAPAKTCLTHISHTLDAWLEHHPLPDNSPPATSFAYDGLALEYSNSRQCV